jgi:hypothetical protein
MHPTRIFKTPDELLQAWEGYKASLKERAKEWPKVQYVGKDGVRQEDYPKLPLTMDGFEVYCYNNHGCVHHYFDNKEGYYEDFGTITSRIRKEIRDDQITGAMVGDYSSNITARLNGLKEVTDTTNRTEVKILNIDPLDDSTDNKSS